MKIRKGFVLRPTLGYTVVVATGELASKFKGMIKLNETSADIWRWIDEGCSPEELKERYMKTYGVTDEVAARDIELTIENMKKADVFEG